MASGFDEIDTKKSKKPRDCHVVEFVGNYGAYGKGDVAGFHEARAKRLCGITEQTPKGLPRAVAKLIGVNKGGEFKAV